MVLIEGKKVIAVNMNDGDVCQKEVGDTVNLIAEEDGDYEIKGDRKQ